MQHVLKLDPLFLVALDDLSQQGLLLLQRGLHDSTSILLVLVGYH